MSALSPHRAQCAHESAHRAALSPERSLWLAVLGEQVRLVLRERDRLSEAPAGEEERAVGWLGSRDFRVVCALAGVSPEWVERKVSEDLHRPLGMRAAHASRWRREAVGARSHARVALARPFAGGREAPARESSPTSEGRP